MMNENAVFELCNVTIYLVFEYSINPRTLLGHDYRAVSGSWQDGYVPARLHPISPLLGCETGREIAYDAG